MQKGTKTWDLQMSFRMKRSLYDRIRSLATRRGKTMHRIIAAMVERQLEIEEREGDEETCSTAY